MSDEKLIERYDPDFDEDQDGHMHYVGMTEAEAGEYVEFADAKGIIDALTARVAELEARVSALQSPEDAFTEGEGILISNLRSEVRAATARAEAAERDRDMRRGELVAAASEATALRAEQAEFRAALAIAQKEADGLRAEVERLRALCGEHEDAFADLLSRHTLTKTRLAAANALLGRLVKYAQEDNARTPGSTRLARALNEAALALSAPTPTEREAAERKVLEAMSGLEEDWLMACQKLKNDAVWPTLATAELARRAVKP
jgi:chromosome segregation ATPase